MWLSRVIRVVCWFAVLRLGVLLALWACMYLMVMVLMEVLMVTGLIEAMYWWGMVMAKGLMESLMVMGGLVSGLMATM